MNGVPAWVLEVSPTISLAVGQFEVAHMVDQMCLTPVVQAPEHCKYVTIWNNRIVPIFNIAQWLSANNHIENLTDKQSDHYRIIAILTYKLEDGKLAYGGIPLSKAPVLEKISNNQQCELPTDTEKWKKIAISCFRSQNDQIVPILDVQSLFKNRQSL
ncbi:hypothetical protein MNBD_GAMMA06-313 [hydrothermal vent metagenome]|uniref:CheW-like domain-containing protein n=1 Tax=hydrothermal vent metagenome TaxID=652676 RepID=A0A3B0WGF9_9ZZZZ